MTETAPSAPPNGGTLQANPSQRIARIVMLVGVIAVMSPSDASSSRNSAGRIEPAGSKRRGLGGTLSAGDHPGHQCGRRHHAEDTDGQHDDRDDDLDDRETLAVLDGLHCLLTLPTSLIITESL